ncbi:arginine deiminase [Leptogranulimonas caecicola]|uniref:Arginine deiminase n=1 Tax=Leptogranulimonas caecicola TaxID=2894156 RepID=A0AAU9CG21_9ACTN|nr:arginine deiminase [Leptogranulimonas caecicola]BDC91182.1 arginine deiminase [Leptogranulimonas caecicola]
MSKGLHVPSEIGNLKKVMLHRPGDELLNLPPDELERLLFDDVPFLPVAQEEHDTFAQTLRDQGVEVLYLEKLMAEALDAAPQARDEFLDQWIEEAGISGKHAPAIIREYIDSFKDNYEMVLHSMAGVTKQEVQLPVKSSKTLRSIVGTDGDTESDLLVDPMPNLYFTRDPFAVVGNGVNLNRMYSVTRNRETLYGKYIFKYHPDYKDSPLWYRRNSAYHTEGGDVLNLNSHAIAVGISQRTEAAAIDVMANHMFWSHGENCPIDEIYAFNIPVSRAFMHLDTVFTQIDVDKFTIHPAIMGTLQVFKMTPGAHENEVKIEEMNDTLEHTLAKILGLDQVTLIPCGGGDPIAAAREQWNDGSNTLCVRPGTICVYQRNNVTNDILYKAGMELLVIPSAELSRGRGGPRCMSMPFWREDL